MALRRACLALLDPSNDATQLVNACHANAVDFHGQILHRHLLALDQTAWPKRFEAEKMVQLIIIPRIGSKIRVELNVNKTTNRF